jgi:hemolysin III
MEPIPVVKPRLRGVSHQIACLVAAAGCVPLVALAPSTRSRLAAAVYAVSLVGLFATSALYHRVDWSQAARRWMRRLDHSMIFVLVAGTATPFALLVLSPTLATIVLALAWGGTAVGMLLSLVWVDAPRWLWVAAYIALGWVGIVAAPQLTERAGPWAMTLLAVGGAFYTVGAVVYALRRPDPRPAVFGYHEIFHALVIAAAAAHFAAVAAFAVHR